MYNVGINRIILLSIANSVTLLLCYFETGTKMRLKYKF